MTRRTPGTPLRASVVRAALEGRRFGVDVRLFGIVDSTQRLARDLDARGVRDGVVVLADGQTAGRGRRGHTWTSPPRSGIYASIVLAKPSDPRLLAAACALALVDAADACGVRGGIKWPNDLVVDDAKCGGALVEAGTEGRVVAGFGLNLETPPTPPADGDLPVFPAGGLRRDGVAPAREALVVALLRAFEDRLAAAETAPDALCAAFQSRDVLKGRRVGIDTEAGRVDGRWESCHPLEGVVLVRDDGRRETFRAEWTRMVAVAPRSGDG